jgi:hypothetical protein
MKSVILTKYGAPEVLKVKELKDLEPSNKQVKIKVHYAGINFAEIMARMKLYPGGPKPGSVLGGEVSGVIDEIGEQIIMSKFVYYNNDFTVNGNPTVAADYYNYLKGIWIDGQPMTYGGTGWDPNNPECDFMFPGNTDSNFDNEWSEVTAGNTPADRRFLQSAGPFTLEPGAVNYITVGFPFTVKSLL